MLRLGQPAASTLSGWLGRAADLALSSRAAAPAAHAEFGSSIITRLAPSHELARR